MSGERARLLRMEEELHKRIVGQDHVIESVSDAVRRSRSGLQDKLRPLGSFLLLGPTGVGKTELCKALAWFLFDDDRAILRLDMSEYMERHSTSRLIGAPPGYVGYDEGGLLTEGVRRRPYQVILFDEIEKAHRDVFDLLLQVLDEGQLTDSHGRRVDFRHSIIILTSNLGSDALAAQAESADADNHSARNLALEAARAHFRPEFLNRLDEIQVFHRLQPEHMGTIVDIQLDRLRLILAEQKIELAPADPAVREKLAQEGYSPTYGARPLRRVIQRTIQDKIAKKLLSGALGEGMVVKLVLSQDESGSVIDIKAENTAPRPTEPSAHNHERTQSSSAYSRRKVA